MIWLKGASALKAEFIVYWQDGFTAQMTHIAQIGVQHL